MAKEWQWNLQCMAKPMTEDLDVSWQNDTLDWRCSSLQWMQWPAPIATWWLTAKQLILNGQNSIFKAGCWYPKIPQMKLGDDYSMWVPQPYLTLRAYTKLTPTETLPHGFCSFSQQTFYMTILTNLPFNFFERSDVQLWHELCKVGEGNPNGISLPATIACVV